MPLPSSIYLVAGPGLAPGTHANETYVVTILQPAIYKKKHNNLISCLLNNI